MLIDPFSNSWIEELDARAASLDRSDRLFLFVDGAFVPNLHKWLPADRKALLFALLPGCSETAEAASPFLTPYERDNKQLKTLLQRCDRWPMLSAITTSEPLGQLAERLAAWCVIGADDQRFNLRFPDTRRLPAIFGVLTAQQRAAFAGSMKRWSYMGRDGRWNELPVTATSSDGEATPILNQPQFASLVDDSRADELLVLLRDRGHDVFRLPSRSHSLLSIALRAACATQLDNGDILPWCAWFWKQDKLHDDSVAAELLQSWQNKSS
ncbi:DUF4123 domain-containing protein [Massilia sp. GCM10023247]|uniref:DUF4123 domain-containing protein n=1 Tax=Massilia sp. GCM10023247 TaxID=3252643 RepID=UPI00360AE871